MNFLNPSFLWLLPLTGVPVLLHLIQRKKPKRLVFSYIKLIKQADQSLMPKKRLKELLLMICRILMLLLLIFFFSRPVLQQGGLFSGEKDSLALVVLMDVSASMGLVVGGRPALDVAKDQVQTLLRKFNPDVRVGLVAVSDRVETEIAPTTEKTRLSSSLMGLSVTPRSTDLLPAVELATRMLANQSAEKKSILVVSDQAKNGWDSLLLKQGNYEGFDPEVSVMAWEVVDKRDNLGISDATLQLSEEGVLKGQWVVNKKNVKKSDRDWRLLLNKRVVGKGRVLNQAEHQDSVPLQAQLPEGGFYAGQLELTKDSVPFDDVYYLAGRVPKGFRLLIVDGEKGLAPSDSESYYLKLALESPRDPRLESIRVIRPELLSEENLDAVDALVLANVPQMQEIQPQMIRWVEQGGGLLITAGGNWPKAPEIPLNFFRSQAAVRAKETVSAPKETLVFLSQVAQLQTFQWDQIEVNQYRPLEAESGSETILSLKNGDPLLIRKRLGKGSVVCLTTTLDRTWTNLPAKPIFAPLFRELIASLADPLREQTSLNGFVGQPFRARLPAGVKNATVLSPNGTSAGATLLPDGVLEWASPTVPGLYQVKTNNAQYNFRFAINIPNREQEGDLSRLGEEELKTIFPKASVNWIANGRESLKKVLASLQGRDLTKLIIILLFAILLLETILAWPRRKKEWV